MSVRPETHTSSDERAKYVNPQAPDEHIQAMLEAIDKTGREHARAKTYAARLKDQREITLATIMRIKETEGVAAVAKQKREALLHPMYRDVLERYYQAIEEEVNARTAAENAVRLFEGWRTAESTQRALIRGGA